MIIFKYKKKRGRYYERRFNGGDQDESKRRKNSR